MTKTTVEFVYYLVCVGLLIAGLHLADVRPWTEWTLLFGLRWIADDVRVLHRQRNSLIVAFGELVAGR
jgi:hypothetical protein